MRQLKFWGCIISLCFLLIAEGFLGQEIHLPLLGVGWTSGATPGFVNDTSLNSLTSGQTLNTVVDNNCASYTMCATMGDGTLTGNLEIIAGEFHNATSITPTATDNGGSNSYTCTTGGTAESAVWPYFCYALNVTAGATIAKPAFGTTAASTVAVRTAQFNNIATSSALDGSLGTCGGISTSSPGCASVTTTAANDLVWAIFCPVSTPAISSFTPGSGYTAEEADLQTGCEVEWEVDTGTGSITPTATFGVSSSYVEIVAAFKSATAGTAPTGTYIARQMSFSVIGPVATGNMNMKLPAGGSDLLVGTYSTATITTTGVTDGTNTWTTTSNYAAVSNTNESYVINATANTGGAITVNTSGTGDGTWKFYDFVGVPTTASVVRSKLDDTNGFASSTTYYPYVVSQPGGWTPIPTSGLWVFTGSQNNNTTLNVNTPTGCVGDSNTYGGEPADGPSIIDENNAYGHCYTTGTAPTSIFTLTITTASGTNGEQIDGLEFWNSSSATAVVSNFNVQSTGASTFLQSTSLPSTTSGDLFIATVGIFNSTARTASKVCLGGNSTCSTGTQLTECTSCVSASSGKAATSIWYALSAPSAATQIDVVASASAANIEVATYEARSPNAWSIDTNGSQTSNGTGGSTSVSAPTVSTTGTVDVCASHVGVSTGLSQSHNAPAGANFMQSSGFFTNLNDASALGMFTSTGSYGASFSDANSGDGFNASTMCFKHS